MGVMAVIESNHRFWSLVDKRTDEECWPWKGNLSGRNGDRAYYYDPQTGKDFVATRFMLDPPKDMFVCHSCDNPSCVNPSHLFLGTNGDNMRDASNKGRLYQQDKEKCDNGHDLSGDNLKVTKGRNRVCKICANKRNREYRLRIKSKAAMQGDL